MIFQGRQLTISIGTARIWPAEILGGERATGHKRISLKATQICKYFCECQSCCYSQCDPWGRSRPPCIESPCKSRPCHTGAGLHIMISKKEYITLYVPWGKAWQMSKNADYLFQRCLCKGQHSGLEFPGTVYENNISYFSFSIFIAHFM